MHIYDFHCKMCNSNNLFNVGDVLLCVIYQLNFTVSMYVT